LSTNAEVRMTNHLAITKVYRAGLIVSFLEVDKVKTQQKFQVSNCEMLKKTTTTTTK